MIIPQVLKSEDEQAFPDLDPLLPACQPGHVRSADIAFPSKDWSKLGRREMSERDRGERALSSELYLECWWDSR